MDFEKPPGLFIELYQFLPDATPLRQLKDLGVD
jgi:hypothetical protein